MKNIHYQRLCFYSLYGCQANMAKIQEQEFKLFPFFLFCFIPPKSPWKQSTTGIVCYLGIPKTKSVCKNNTKKLDRLCFFMFSPIPSNLHFLLWSWSLEYVSFSILSSWDCKRHSKWKNCDFGSSLYARADIWMFLHFLRDC